MTRHSDVIKETDIEVWQYVCSYRGREGRSPSYEEIADHMDWASLRSVSLHVDALVSAGLLEKDRTKKRILQPTGKTPDDLDDE